MVKDIIKAFLITMLGVTWPLLMLNYIALNISIINPIVLILTMSLFSILGHFYFTEIKSSVFRFWRSVYLYILYFNIATIINFLMVMRVYDNV